MTSNIPRTTSSNLLVPRHITCPPVITSTPETNAWEDTYYTTQITASDADGHLLGYSLTQAPAGMTISRYEGTVHWIPVYTQTGPQEVTVEVTDFNGATTTLQFSINVNPVNDAPVITSTPVTNGIIAIPYTYQPAVTDEENESISNTLTSSPPGMTIHPVTGLVEWIPNTTGSEIVTLKVTDQRGASSEQSWTITISASDTEPPKAGITVAPLTTAPGEPITITVTSADNVAVATSALTIDGVGVTLTSNSAVYKFCIALFCSTKASNI